MYWMYGCSLDVTFTLAASARAPGEDFKTLPGTEMRESTFGAHVTRVLMMPKLDLTLSAVYTLPLPQLSRNVSWEGIQVGVGLRYHWFPGYR